MSDPFFQPPSGSELPRFAGIPTFMRLPHVPEGHPRRSEVDVGFIGLPWDGATSNRPGARHGPRALRDASTMIRARNRATGQTPFASLACADLGDVAMSPVEQDGALANAEAAVAAALKDGIKTLMVGGDHLCTLPVMRAHRAHLGAPFGLVLFDSHTDLYPPYFGGRVLTHGNPFRQGVIEGLIDPKRSVMIGMRGTSYDTEDFDFGAEHGLRIIPVEECFDRGWPTVLAEARGILGDTPAYLSFDIDFIDPAFAPGTGTPEVGGPTSRQAIDCVRAMRGLNLIGADLVEVSPPFDPSGGTAWLGASILFEILCLFAP